jgi:prophage DNA circulation protein
MSQISDIQNPWRVVLLREQASWRGVNFHVENGGRSSGRRSVVHEYPKRNDPYAEDMGRHVRRFQISGYLIYRPRKLNEANPMLYDYVSQRKKLYEALEADDIGKLVHPVFAPGGMDALCERYAMTESRERGGFTQFEMSFVESGKAVSFINAAVNTKSTVGNVATTAEQNAITVPLGPL